MSATALLDCNTFGCPHKVEVIVGAKIGEGMREIEEDEEILCGECRDA